MSLQLITFHINQIGNQNVSLCQRGGEKSSDKNSTTKLKTASSLLHLYVEKQNLTNGSSRYVKYAGFRHNGPKDVGFENDDLFVNVIYLLIGKKPLKVKHQKRLNINSLIA